MTNKKRQGALKIILSHARVALSEDFIMIHVDEEEPSDGEYQIHIK